MTFAQEGNDQRQREGPVWEMYVARGKNQESGFVVVAQDLGRKSYVWVLAAVGMSCDGELLPVIFWGLGL